MTGARYRDLVLGIRDSVPPTTPGKLGTMTTPGAPGLPVIPGDLITPGDSVRPMFTGQEAQKEKIDKRLDRSELPVLNSPGRSVQLEHNVHKQPRNMPNCKLNICQSILKSFKTLRTLTVRMSRHTSFPNALNCHILNMCLRASITPATLWASVTLVTGETKSMGKSEPDIILMSLVLHGEIVTNVVILFLSNTLNQVNILQLQ